jgi:hypothetical protein
LALNTRQARTLAAIFTSPTPNTIRWNEVESLLEAIGAELDERAGSRVAIMIQGRVNVIHKPHPRPTMNRATVRDIKRLLEAAGITPE